MTMAKLMKTMDGNQAAAHVAYAFTDVAAIYPITPSSPMAEHVDEWAAHGMKNLFGDEVMVTELQSEAGAAGAVHGSLVSGALTTTFTASQGLLLMIPNMYKIAGEHLPGVFHVSARALSTHALSIFGDHQDVMAARATGFAMLASGSVQEVMDIGSVAHLAALKAEVPFLHFFDGFRTSHEIQKVEVMDHESLRDLVDYDALARFRDKALRPSAPKTMGTAQNPDIYFQAMEASNPYYDAVPGIVEEYMEKMSEITGRKYGLFNYYGAPDADRVIIAMGSVTETIEEVVDYLSAKGEKVGLLKVHLYRPFSIEHFLKEMPKSVKKIAVLDRTKEKGAEGQPLYLDVKNAYYEENDRPVIVGGIYGLGSKDTTPTDIKAVYDSLKNEKPKNNFTIGIVDDVTMRSLEISDMINTESEDTIRCKFWGFGSDGTVGANKSAIKIIGDGTDMYAQAYFAYDSKKSGGVTISHLRFGHEPIRSTYLITQPDFISCSKQSYVFDFDLLKGLKKGGTFLLNTIWEKDELEEHLPNNLKRELAEAEAKFYIINASKIAGEIGLGGRTNMVMQSAFFKLSGVLPIEEATKKLKESIEKTYGKKGEDIVRMNWAAVDAGINALVEIEVKPEWKNLKDEAKDKGERPDFVKNVADVMNAQRGDDLPVSAFVDRENGEFPQGTTAYEKRCIALRVPEWIPDNCIQCNQCALVCPHATIRPFLATEEEMANAPEGFVGKKAVGKGLEGMSFRIQVDPMDCTGCGNCADVCPAKQKALVMSPFEKEFNEQKENWEYAHKTVGYKEDLLADTTVKGSQFKQPLIEFSGACAGCGETPYVKLITQLFGDRMMVANATGCSSIWGGSAPSTPFCTNAEGHGPSWASSLFEDNAEYGYGMAMALKNRRLRLQNLMNAYIALNLGDKNTELFKAWIDSMHDAKASKVATADILEILDKKVGNKEADEIVAKIAELKEFLLKRSVWVFGGDGWAYDIGYGGLDHVLASDEDINIFVMDTEVYSNTGGQSSKSTPTAAVAKFAAAGKRVRKKDLGLMQSTYGYVYVAQIAMGANMNQTLKALHEAESYNGPSLVIAYSPCINHGIRGGMGGSSKRMKKAVEAGYWHLWRYDPRLKEQGKNPFVLDSKEPTESFQDFIAEEVRYTSLKRSFPEISAALFEKAENDAKARYESYVAMAEKQVF